MKEIILILSLFFINLIFSQAQKSNYTLIARKIGVDYPYNPIISKKINGKDVLRKKFQFLDSLNYYSINYKSFDNLNLRGFMVSPQEKGVYPVLIYNRGGNGDYGTVTPFFLLNFLSQIANQGYIIIGSQLRGTSVSEGFDEFGGKDVNDVLSLFDIIDQLPNVDKDRIGILGWSRGVMTNFLMLKKTNRIKTNISIAGPADLIDSNRVEMFKMFRERMPNYAKDSTLALQKRSCLLAIDSISNRNITNFIIQGNKDVRVNVKNAFKLYDKLNTSKFTTKLLIYENEGHDLENVKDNLIENIKDWLKKYL